MLGISIGYCWPATKLLSEPWSIKLWAPAFSPAFSPFFLAGWVPAGTNVSAHHRGTTVWGPHLCEGLDASILQHRLQVTWPGRLDPFASRKTQGNNVQPNYAKVTSAVEDNIDHLMRAYGSLAAEIDPEDRLKLLSSRPSWGGRRSSGTEPNLWKAARSLENESGEAPSRSSMQRPGHTGHVTNEVRTTPPEREPPQETTQISPQVLGKQVEETSNAGLTPIQHKSGPSHWGAQAPVWYLDAAHWAATHTGSSASRGKCGGK